MNKTSAKTSAKKDEALKMAVDFMKTLTIDVGIKTWNEKHRKEAIQACKEALEQPAMTYEQGFAHGYEAHRVEQELEQPAQDFFERGKEIAKWADKQNEQPAQEPVAWECFLDPAYYDMWAIRQTGNRNFEETIHVVNGKEAKHLCAWLNSLNTHPAPSWVGLSDDEIRKVIIDEQIPVRTGKTANRFARAIEQALKEKNHD